MMAHGNCFFVAGAKVCLLITLHLKIDDFIFSLSSLKKKKQRTSQLHPSHHGLFPNSHSLKPHLLWLSWLLQAHILLNAVGKEAKTSQNMPAILVRGLHSSSPPLLVTRLASGNL